MTGIPGSPAHLSCGSWRWFRSASDRILFMSLSVMDASCIVVAPRHRPSPNFAFSLCFYLVPTQALLPPFNCIFIYKYYLALFGVRKLYSCVQAFLWCLHPHFSVRNLCFYYFDTYYLLTVDTHSLVKFCICAHTHYT